MAFRPFFGLLATSLLLLACSQSVTQNVLLPKSPNERTFYALGGVSLDDGETDVPVGEVGELLMAGPQIMKGYYGMPTETANSLREKDGKIWLYTGDIARMDEDGYFYIVDRKKDMALNDAQPSIDIDPERYTVTIDGERIEPRPASVLPLAQRYFLF